MDLTPERIIAACACILITLGCPPPGEGRAREPLPGVFIEARDLTRAEMTEVRRLAGTTGRAPWLIYGFRFGPGPKSAPRRTRIEIYLQPDVENSRLRRGRVLHAEFSPAGGGRTVSARLESTSRYAHVVVLGRAPDEVRGKWDPHRPFIVDGDFDDETLFRLVALVRRSPEGPRLPSGEVSSNSR